MNRAPPSTVTFGAAALGIALGCAAACQYATGLSGFDTREDGGGGAATTDASATQDASATTSRSTAGSTGAVVTILAEDLERPADIVLADGTLYFIELGPEGGLGRISSVPADGSGMPQPIVSGLSGLTSLAVSGKKLYFADATPNRLSMIDLMDQMPMVHEIANGFFGNVRHVAVDATHVYFATGNGIRRVLLDGTTLETISTEAIPTVHWLDVGDTPGYVARSDGVASFAKTAPATLEPLFSAGDGVTAMARGLDHVFTIEFSGVFVHALGGGVVGFPPMDPARRIAMHPTIPTRAIWTVYNELHTGTVAGDDVTTISAGFDALLGLAVAPGFAYVTDSHLTLGRVVRIELPTF